MSSIKYLSVMSASMLILAQSASALEIGDGGLPWLPNNISDTHHTHPLELKPIPSSGYLVAKSQFLPDVVESDNSFNDYRELDNDYNKGDCKNKSSLFTTKSCSYPRAVLASSKCTFVPGYYKDCVCQPQFTITSCPSPKYKSSPQCDGKAERCLCPATVSLNNPNDKCTQTCDGNCITKTCTPTPGETGCQYGTNSVSDNCGGTRQVCKPCNLTPCSGLSSKPDNSYYITSSCTDCSGTKTINSGWECSSGYHKSGNMCAPNCSLPNCNNSVSSKPLNSYYLTSSCTDCSGTKTINTGWSCNAGYTQSGNTCVNLPKAGDILYSDMTTSPDIVAGKTPIAIVFDPERRLAVSIEHSGHIRFSEEKNIPFISGLADNIISGYSKYTPPYESGKDNTAILLSFGKSKNLHFSAAEYCNNYKTPGTSSGQWFLPSHYEFIVPLQADFDKLNNIAKSLGSSFGTRFWTSSNRQVFASIRMEGNNSFYMDYGGPSDAAAASESFYKTYAYCGYHY